jgi:hypothetical protein
MYDLTMSVREAMAVLIIFIFDIHFYDLMEYFLAISETEGIAILEDRQKNPVQDKNRQDMEKKIREKSPTNNPSTRKELEKFSL